MEQSISIVVVAGGSGKRMGSHIPKQFLLLNDLPILMHTLLRFNRYAPNAEIILVLPESEKGRWKSLIDEYGFLVPHVVVKGGKERFHSVQNGLEECHGKYIFIHDGVRPFVSHETLNRCLSALENYQAVVPVLPVKDSIRMVQGHGSKALKRQDLYAVQTPQCFHANALKKVFSTGYQEQFTDDASVFEWAGHAIHMVLGNEENIKITTALDLKWAEMLQNNG